MKVWSAIFYKYIVKILWKKLRICVILKNKDSEVIMMINIRKLESELWESADLLRSSSKLTSNQYCMPVMGLIFLRYAYSRFKAAEMEILKDRPSRGGRILPVEASDFKERSALFLPKEAQYDYLLNLPGDIASADIKNINGGALYKNANGVLGYGARLKGYIGVQLANPDAVSAIVNITSVVLFVT